MTRIIPTMNISLLDSVLSNLKKSRGNWREVAKGSGVPYDTITKIAQGQSPNPGVLTVQKLADYFNPPKSRKRPTKRKAS